MMMTFRRVLLLGTVSTCLASNLALAAAADNFYIDAKFGRAFLALPRSDVDGSLSAAAASFGATVAPANLSRASGGYSFGIGYSVTRNIAIEAAYDRFGNFHGTANGNYAGVPF